MPGSSAGCSGRDSVTESEHEPASYGEFCERVTAGTDQRGRLTTGAGIVDLTLHVRRLLEEARYLSLGQAATRFGISHSHLKLLARTGKLRAFKIGKSWVTTPAAVAEHISDPQLRSKDPYKNKRR
jgi:hypothetical protein